VAKNAALLCGATDAQIFRVDEGFLFRAASHGLIPAPPQRPITRDWVTGRAVVDRQTIHVHDLAEDADYPVGRESARQTGHHTTLAVPLLREGVALGAILVRRMEVHPFADTPRPAFASCPRSAGRRVSRWLASCGPTSSRST
jgi:hypothetical protein